MKSSDRNYYRRKAQREKTSWWKSKINAAKKAVQSLVATTTRIVREAYDGAKRSEVVKGLAKAAGNSAIQETVKREVDHLATHGHKYIDWVRRLFS